MGGGMSLDIANTAMDMLGVPPLHSLSARSKTADLVARNLPKAIEYTLRRGLWSEATITVCPDQILVDKLPESFCYAFALPCDFARAFDVEYLREKHDKHHGREVRRNVQWKISKVKTGTGPKEALLTDCENIQLEYICKDHGERLPQDIADLVAINLAYRIALPLKADKSLRRDLKESFKSELAEAEAISSGQDNEELEIPDGDLINSRRFGLSRSFGFSRAFGDAPYGYKDG